VHPRCLVPGRASLRRPGAAPQLKRDPLDGDDGHDPSRTRAFPLSRPRCCIWPSRRERSCPRAHAWRPLARSETVRRCPIRHYPRVRCGICLGLAMVVPFCSTLAGLGAFARRGSGETSATQPARRGCLATWLLVREDRTPASQEEWIAPPCRRLTSA